VDAGPVTHAQQVRLVSGGQKSRAQSTCSGSKHRCALLLLESRMHPTTGESASNMRSMHAAAMEQRNCRHVVTPDLDGYGLVADLLIGQRSGLHRRTDVTDHIGFPRNTT